MMVDWFSFMLGVFGVTSLFLLFSLFDDMGLVLCCFVLGGLFGVGLAVKQVSGKTENV